MGRSFDRSIKNVEMVYDNLRKIAPDQGDDYRTECLLGCPYLKQHIKIIPTNLSKQKVLDANYRAIQQIYFTSNAGRVAGATMFLVLEEKSNFCQIFQITP